MPQDVRFDLPFDTPVSEHLQYARARHLRWVWEMRLVRSREGFEEYKSWDLPLAAARTPSTTPVKPPVPVPLVVRRHR